MAGLQVRLIKEGERTAVLGEFTRNASDISFAAVAPLTRGLRYEVLEGGISIGEIEIPESDDAAPELLAIYPTQDTVPENLLKVYLHFSASMTEGRSADFVHLLSSEGDTLKGTFLDLQPELWNEDGTVLTLWLDPGRIKLDLIPNKELGSPLQRGMSYALAVAPGWESKSGIASKALATKQFIVGDRDDLSPKADTWNLLVPEAGKKTPLTIEFGEPIDHTLAIMAIRVLDNAHEPIEGAVEISKEEQQFQFTPIASWKSGSYIIEIEGRLEDLAGNNLNRLFETDLSKPGQRKEDQPIFERKFSIE